MPLEKDELDVIASRMLADYDAVTPGTVFADGLRLGLPDAWAVQAAVTALRTSRGERVAGYKVGCVSPGNQKMMGLPHPVWGQLWKSEIHAGGAALRKDSYANIAIEAEFGVTFSKDLTPGASIDEIAESVKAVYPTLELHNLVMRSDQPHGQALVANNCINCGVVLGTPVTDLSAPRQTDLALIFDGEIVDDWQALRWPEDILAAIDWLSSSLAEHGMRIQSDDLILTSAWGPPIPVADHTRVDVTSSAFGNVFATFE